MLVSEKFSKIAASDALDSVDSTRLPNQLNSKVPTARALTKAWTFASKFCTARCSPLNAYIGAEIISYIPIVKAPILRERETR